MKKIVPLSHESVYSYVWRYAFCSFRQNLYSSGSQSSNVPQAATASSLVGPYPLEQYQ